MIPVPEIGVRLFLRSGQHQHHRVPAAIHDCIPAVHHGLLRRRVLLRVGDFYRVVRRRIRHRRGRRECHRALFQIDRVIRLHGLFRAVDLHLRHRRHILHRQMVFLHTFLRVVPHGLSVGQPVFRLIEVSGTRRRVGIEHNNGDIARHIRRLERLALCDLLEAALCLIIERPVVLEERPPHLRDTLAELGKRHVLLPRVSVVDARPDVEKLHPMELSIACRIPDARPGLLAVLIHAVAGVLPVPAAEHTVAPP